MRPFYLLTFTIICISTSLYAQQFPRAIEWQKCFGGTKDDKANGIIHAIDGGYLVFGSTKSNDGDLTGHTGPADYTDGWLVKLSTSGALEWQRNYSGTNAQEFGVEFNSVIRTSDGDYICFGTTLVNDVNDRDWLILKIDRNGNIIWQKSLGGTKYETAGNVKQFSDGRLYFIGASQSVDGDVPINPVHAPGADDVWIVKMDLAGNISFNKTYGGTFHEYGYDIAESPGGTFIIALTSLSTDGDFGNVGGTGIVAKIDSATGVKWKYVRSQSTPAALVAEDGSYRVTYSEQVCLTQSPSIALSSLQVDETTPVSATARKFIRFSYCLPPGLTTWGYRPGGPTSYVKWNSIDRLNVGSYDTAMNQPAPMTSPHGSRDGFIASYYDSGPDSARLSWKKFIGGSDEDFLTGVMAVSDSGFVVAGYTKSNDDDVSGNHGGFDIWVVKLGNANVVKGTVFIDRNSNGIKDGNDPVADNILVETKKGTRTLASNTSQGLFANTVDTGTFVTKPILNQSYYTAFPASYNSVFTTFNNIDSIAFALQPIPGKKDYRLELLAINPARPGFAVRYVLKYENIGTDTFTNKNIWFVKDSRLNFVSVVPGATSVSGDTLRWNIASLVPGQSGLIEISTIAAAPPTLQNGDTLTISALIDSTGDLTPANNHNTLQQVVVGSYDPNDKMEMHAGAMPQGELNSGKPLVYTIRFQNTGTDTAFNIVIRDTLDAKLDWSSLEMIGASHANTLSVKEGNMLTWTFANILLVDSNRNEPASHGYVAYRIKVKPGWAIGDKIHNKASIYFDFNLPVETNTTETTISTDPPPTPVITGLQTNYCGLTGVTSVKVMNLPATGSGITVTVKIDNNSVPLGADSTFSFNVSTLSPGAHTVTIQYSNAAANRISSSSFTITEAIEPNVNLSASLTTITNLAIPVIVTAENAAGGGTGPLYTFARDRNFTNITQAEGLNNTWTFNPSILAIGDNKIYVRMRSNATCLVTNTAIDSILLVRSSVTGITDPDMPGQVINIYPNPFKDAITINGLSTAKTYTVKLFDLEGKQLVSKRVSGRTTISLTPRHQATGIYWLSIYDEKRKQLLGTVKMMKQ